jgi:hypothetical protein
VSVDRPEDVRASSTSPPPVDAPEGDVELRSVVVRYESSPDRRTVYPVGVEEDERLTLWLSADADAFVDLDASR